MAFSNIFVLTFVLAAFVSSDAFRIKTREDGMRLFPSEMQLNSFKRYQTADSELDLPTLFELYELEKRRMIPYSGGIFGR